MFNGNFLKDISFGVDKLRGISVLRKDKQLARKIAALLSSGLGGLIRTECECV